MQKIKWGIIGCGDVCEVKSGPAFNKVNNSELLAVMRRDLDKANDYAKRHGVPESYNDYSKIIDHPEINAVYIATPPAYHEVYAIKAIEAGKMVYIEKPVALNADSCRNIISAAETHNQKVSVAHYRRALPMFLRIKEIIHNGLLGKVRLANIKLYHSLNENLIASSNENWRVKPGISGGGLFHDLAPHQLDIMYWLFGNPIHMFGGALNQTNLYDAPDINSFEAILKYGVFIHGIWLFNNQYIESEDTCEIIGDKGKILFSFFRNPKLKIEIEGQITEEIFDFPQNIQLPMIEKVVSYFLDKDSNPCSLEEALISLKMMDSTI